ncbi:flagellar biosynthesis protein FlhF [Bacillus chungangensis]|uniref:Flagellar biosynthesis protein FlhF n=1 Tax=Bacillus chungangensis TaxID=587633 RepID=A0ABT9WRR7_9BACI|nr:flagellar biosynthesis protein FlhF [Bacillus chungangensis]MDQ0175804.1 flagellar biosynthesis protein FlhF [Bacillus chungangensis]
MKVKKYVAPTMPEVMKRVRAELGDDAIILHSKKITTSGFLGLFKKKNIEVIAAVDLEVKQIKKNNPVKTAVKNSTPKLQRNVPTRTAAADDQKLYQEVASLKSMLQTMSAPGHLATAHYPVLLQNWLLHLEEQELAQKHQQAISEKLLEKWRNKNEEVSSRELKEWTREIVEKQLSSFQHGGAIKKRFVNILGPTGVGKTTTLAKMAAHEVLEKNKKVAFITTDTYRIAAIEQLKVYANLLNVPLEVVYKREDFQKAVDKFHDYDLIFIDTAGRNYRDPQYMDELKKIIDFEQEMENYLALSLSMKEKDLRAIIHNFSSISIDKFVFTKIDETIAYGSMLNLIFDYKIGVAYVTNGQDVPDDMIEASPKVLAEYLLKVEEQ